MTGQTKPRSRGDSIIDAGTKSESLLGHHSATRNVCRGWRPPAVVFWCFGVLVFSMFMMFCFAHPVLLFR